MPPRHSPLARYLLGAYWLLVGYGSLYPFSGWRDQGLSPFEFLGAPLPQYVTGFDVVANFVAYVPLGFLAVLAFAPRLRGAAACIALFLVLYVTRVALGGVKAFPGPAVVRTFLYLPVLSVHIALSIVAVPLVIHNLLTGLRLPARDLPLTAHPRVGRWAVRLWSVSLALGIVVYLLLNVLF